MSDPLRRLLDFHRLSRDLAAARELLGGVPDDMRALHDEFTAERAALDALEGAALEAKKKRIAAEGAVADAQERLRKFQQQVSRVPSGSTGLRRPNRFRPSPRSRCATERLPEAGRRY